ncbi:MAG: PfkB family carbohydrate kinase [Anaerolineae bacterium]
MPDYLLIGHVSKDLIPGGARLGGTVSFSGLMAAALGHRTAILTSGPDDMAPLLDPLKALQISRVPSEEATTFENVYTPAGRVQTLLGRAASLGPAHLPPGWERAAIVHLAPVADEVDPALLRHFPGALVGVTPQGWMRRWDEAGRVLYREWREADPVLRAADAVVLSIEDIQHDETLAAYYGQIARVLVVTRNAHGCTLYVQGKAQHVPAPQVTELDPTGAGDIFAAAFFSRLKATGNPLRAARFATYLASDSVTRAGPESLPSAETISRALSAY